MKTRLDELHERVVAWGRKRAGLEEQECRLLLEAEQAEVHTHVGMGFAEYVERFIGHSPRETTERLRVARVLEAQPATAEAFRKGEVCWSVVRELTRILRPHTEKAWLEHVKGMPARRVEWVVAGHKPGDWPSDPMNERLRRHVLSVELSAETMATLKAAIAKLKGDGMDEDAAYLELARAVLAPSDTGKSSYQIGVFHCRSCEQDFQEADGQLIGVEPAIAEAACCDGTEITGRARQSVTPALRRQIFLRDNHRCRVPGCPNRRYLDIHHVIPQDEFGVSEPDNLILLCGMHHHAHHRGQLLIDRTHVGKLEFRHADGAPYGSPRSPSAALAYANAFQELRERGLSETPAHEMLQSHP